jgi:uncharacterized protein YkwD
MRIRPKAVLCVLSIALVLVATAGAVKMRRAPALENALVSEVNDLRRQQGLPPVRPSPQLRAAAAHHSREMGANGYFAHNSADGTVFWVRIRRFYDYGHARKWQVGENLAWTTGNLSAGRLVQMWLDSPPHREILLSAKWREVGLGAVKVEDAPGFYLGRDVTVITADFGVRSS